MGTARDEVALVDVIRTNPAEQELLDQGLHDYRFVVHMTEQHRLIAQGNPRISESTQGLSDLGGQLAGVVGVNTDKKRVELPEHGTQLRGDTLWQENGNPSADPQELNMGNGP